MSSLFSNASNQSADNTIALNAMAAAAASCTAYLTATLEATTPEVRRLFSEYTTQSVIGHEAITALSIKKGWMSPDDSPTKQLQTSVNESVSVTGTVQ
jgi:spore coat protein CotF